MKYPKITGITFDHWGGIWIYADDGKQYTLSRTGLQNILLGAEITETKECPKNIHIVNIKLK